MVMLNSRFSAKLEHAMHKFLQHRCTILTKTDSGTIDDNGDIIYEYVSTTDVRCLFLWNERNETNERGVTITKVPTLYMLASQVVSDDDLIQDVLARNGTTILLTSAKINTIDNTAEGGNGVLKVLELEGATV